MTEGRKITLTDLQDNIKECYFINTYDAVAAQIPTTQETPSEHLKLMTICVLVLANGFIVTGESACADPAIYDKEKGEGFAFENAQRKIWPLMGYALKNEIMFSLGDYRDRMQREYDELDQKVQKLEVFLAGETIKDLPAVEREDLHEQFRAMRAYRDTLGRRKDRSAK